MNSRVAVALMVAVLLCVTALAYAAAPAKTSGLVDIDVMNVPVRQAVEMIFAGKGLRYIIEPGIAGKVVELKLKGVTVAEALKSLGDAAGFTYTYEEGIYTVSPKVASTQAVAHAAPAPVHVQREPAARPMPREPAPVTINNYIPSDGGDRVAYAPGGYGGYQYYYDGYYPNYHEVPPPWILGQWANPPPPRGLFSPDVDRFLAFEYYVPKRPSFIMPPYWY